MIEEFDTDQVTIAEDSKKSVFHYANDISGQQDGKISLDEFMSIMKQTSLY